MLTQHANKVLSYVPERSPIAAEPKTVSVEQLLHANVGEPDGGPIPPAVIPGRHFFKREALYELVWTAPVSEVASKLGVSDVGTEQTCDTMSLLELTASTAIPAASTPRCATARCSPQSISGNY